MSDTTLLIERLELVLGALERIPNRFASIQTPDDFLADETGVEHMDSICMVLIAAGEEFKRIDKQTEGKLFAAYPQIQWRGVMGMRDVLAHGYFQVDAEQLFTVCDVHVPQLIHTLHLILRELKEGKQH